MFTRQQVERRGMNNDITATEYAITTADEKSINKTSQRFYVSQPAISDAIKDLEEEIGITIMVPQIWYK